MQYSPFRCHLVPLKHKYLFLNPTVEHLQYPYPVDIYTTDIRVLS
jgi:hypothetical protein